jgi:hypothetical protein
MEMSQGNFLYSYLKQRKMSFFFSKLENGRTKQVLAGGRSISGGEEDVGKGCRRVNTMQIMCTQTC